MLDRRQLDGGRQLNSAAGLETARRETAAGQETGVETARRETVLLDSKQLDSWSGGETSGQLEWRLLDGRQLDSVAEWGTTGRTALLDNRRHLDSGSGKC